MHGAVLAAGHHRLTVRSHRHRIEEISRALEGAHLLAALAHETHLAVPGSGHGVPGRADEADGRHFLLRAFNVLLALAGYEVPHLDHLVRAGAGQGAAVP